MRRSSRADYTRGFAFGVQPDHGVFPVVAVSEAGRGRVLGHVPGVHDSESALVGAGARVHLAGAAAAHAGGGAGGFEAAAGKERCC